jgi:hypothetical protein
VSPVPHAGFVPHTQVPLAQRSPCLQQMTPHAGPSGHPPEALHDSGLASTPASLHATSVHTTPLAVQVHELQPSPAGNTSPTAYCVPSCVHVRSLSPHAHTASSIATANDLMTAL